MAMPALWRAHLHGLRTFDRVVSVFPAQAELPQKTMLVSGQGICFCGMKMVTVWLWLHFLHLAQYNGFGVFVVVGEGWRSAANWAIMSFFP